MALPSGAIVPFLMLVMQITCVHVILCSMASIKVNDDNDDEYELRHH